MSKTLRELTAIDQKRLDKLKDLRSKLESGEHVQNKTLKNWLKPEEYQRLFDDWEQQQDIRSYWSSKPSGVSDYETGFRRAMFDYNRAEGYRQAGKMVMARKFQNKAQSGFETCLKSLESELSSDPSIRAWFDRELNFSFGGTMSLDPVGMPRVITSRSLDNMAGGSLSGKLTKAEVKKMIVSDAIENILSPNPEVSEGDIKEKLRRLLENRKKGLF